MQKFVMKLTSASLDRQFVDAYEVHGRRPASFILHLAALVVVLAMGSDAFAVQQWQPTEEITSAAEAYLGERTGKSANRTTVRAGTLDTRHRLPLCGSPLQGFMRRGSEIGARTIVGVRCAGPKPWKVYVPVDVIVSVRILTASRALPRSHLVTASDLTAVERDVSRMTSGYLSDPAQLVGLRLKQPVLAGKAFTPAMLAADQIVRRGQTVTLVATGGGVNISMSGKALADGALGQRIRVENLNSGRVVEGIVRSPEHVEVLVSANTSFFNATPKVSPDPADTQVSNNDR